MRQDFTNSVPAKPDKNRPFLYIACDAEPDASIWNYIQAMRPYLAANHIDYIVGPARVPAGIPRPDLYYYPCLSTDKDRTGCYSIIRVASMHPSAGGFRCAERIKRYRETLSSRPIYISRTRQTEAQGLPAVWDQLTSRNDREAAASFARYEGELARQTVRGICDYCSLSFRDA